ncbi:MBL fold metallo-hydrolase [Brachybacterium saurashtrense]|uniref:MBL fold metallo-hydrolase n=1 Tax=Brachybacterium saurashtrense TaxID=556288 RepID=A0A345YLQ1_9MICO|nr:MBL fold metallo-hydrolase [Brachybacterium saurashtrense]AXK44853.1 MBL fold metallo-hydrolase [Brachybacterium saurashtrense]RRR20738.1 MBL fold metallo-hydrolase [Brachybacterium saurashtrense]
MNTTPTIDVPVQVLSGPTVLIEYAGLRILTDPTFDEPGEYPVMPGYAMTKTSGSPLGTDEVGRIDAVLLSHDEHDDNLDRSGRAFLPRVPVVFTTISGAGRLGGNAKGLAFWDEATLTAPDGTVVTVTGLPARHGPEGSEPVSGDVVGFLLTAPGHPSVYVSGDNASLDYVQQIADRCAPIDTAILFIGGVRHKPMLDAQLVTIDNTQATWIARALQARRVIPAHFEGWAHFQGTREDLTRTFEEAGLADRLTYA